MTTLDVRRVGTSGLRASAVGLGCNNFGMRIDADAARFVVDAALEAGITLFDTADIYGGGRSEEMLGQCLSSVRDDVVIATKFGGRPDEARHDGGASRRWVKQACEASLKRLRTDVIDLYYLHKVDPATPFDETLACIDELIAEGKIRYFAFSNLAGWQVADLAHVASTWPRTRPVAGQVEWNLLQRDVEREIAPACRHFGIATMPYFPLASGLLTGKYRAGQPFPPGSRLADMPVFASIATPANLATVARLSEFATDHGRSVVELAVSWLLAQPGVCSVLAGATTPQQIGQNVAAATWHLTTDDLAHIDDLLADQPPADE